MKHEWAFKSFYTDGSFRTFELLKCAHCGQEKVGVLRPDKRGPMGVYNVYNGRDTCPTPEEIAGQQAKVALAVAGFQAAEAAREEAIARRREEVRVAAKTWNVSPREYPFSLDEARALYDAGFSSGLERGADGGSFEVALRTLGRTDE